MVVVPRGVDHEYKGMSTFVPQLGVCRLDFYKPPLGVLEIHFPLFHLLDSQSFVLSLVFVTQAALRTTMTDAPNAVYTVFSFIGFVMCAIPFYWHLEGTWRDSRHWSMCFENT
jgi:hypothetical protein